MRLLDRYLAIKSKFVTLSDGLQWDASTIPSSAIYTDEQAQDAVGTILTDSTSINFTYTDAAPTITAVALFGASAGTVAEGNHTHTASGITDFSEAVDDRVSALVVAGNNIDVTYNDGANTLTIDVESLTSADITDFATAVDERARDAVGTALVAGNNIDITVNDGADTITIDVESLTSADITDFNTAVDERARDAVGTALVAGNNIDITVNDGSDTITIDVESLTSADISDFAEVVRDTMGTALVAGTNVTITPDDVADTITIAASGGSGSPGGSDTEFQYNNGGAFGGVAELTYDDGTGNIVYNEAGGDNDFRFEGDTDTNLLFTDASTDRIGVGTASPNAKVDIANIAAGVYPLVIRANGSGVAAMQFTDSGYTSQFGYFEISSGVFKLATGTAENIRSYTASVYINEAAGDVDFIVSGDTDADLFKVDAGTDCVGIDGVSADGWFKLKAGTTAKAPLIIPSGTNLTTPTAGTIEYDGTNVYGTLDTTSDRGRVWITQEYRLAANQSASSPAATINDFFTGASSSLSLAASSVYEFEADCFLTKTTAGTLVWTLLASSAPTAMSIGYVGPGLAASVTNMGATTASTTAVTGATASLSNGINFHFRIFGTIETNAACNIRLRCTPSAGTFTPLRNSRYLVRRITGTNQGDFAA